MAATYTKVSRNTPSQQRAAVITNVEQADRIDIEDVLGRPARFVTFLMTDSSDTIEYKINHLQRLYEQRTKAEVLSEVDRVYGVFGKERIDVWHGRSDTFTGTGSSQLQTTEGLAISSIEIVSLTLSSGSTITIEVT